MEHQIATDRSDFRARRDAARMARAQAPFEPGCELHLGKLKFELAAEVRAVFRSVGENASPFLWMEASRLMIARSFVRLSQVLSAVGYQPLSIQECCTPFSLSAIDAEVEAGRWSCATAAMTLGHIRTCANVAHGMCPEALSKLKTELDAEPGRDLSARVGAVSTYVDAAVALAAVGAVFKADGRSRAGRTFRKAALLAFEAQAALRRGELRALNVKHVTIRRSGSGAEFLLVTVWMNKVKRWRIVKISDERVIQLMKYVCPGKCSNIPRQ
jgi:hypothetical protein